MRNLAEEEWTFAYVFASESEGSGDVTLLYLREGFLQEGASLLSVGVEQKKALNERRFTPLHTIHTPYMVEPLEESGELTRPPWLTASSPLGGALRAMVLVGVLRYH